MKNNEPALNEHCRQETKQETGYLFKKRKSHRHKRQQVEGYNFPKAWNKRFTLMKAERHEKFSNESDKSAFFF